MPFDKDNPPRVWTFSGPAGRDTHFDLKVWGQPSAKALRNIIRQLELYAEFVADEPGEAVQAQSSESARKDGAPQKDSALQAQEGGNNG